MEKTIRTHLSILAERMSEMIERKLTIFRVYDYKKNFQNFEKQMK